MAARGFNLTVQVMDTVAISAGMKVMARTAFGNVVERRAVGSPEMSDFVIVRLVREEEWQAALSEGREPVSVPWPAEDVWLAEV